MKNLTKLALPLALLFGWGFFSTASKLQRLVPYFRFVRWKGIRMGYVNLVFDILIENPNRRDLTLQEIVADIYFQGDPISQIRMYNKKIRLRALQTTRIPDINVRLSLTELGNQLLNVITNGSRGATLDITGTIKANGMTFPFQQTTVLNHK